MIRPSGSSSLSIRCFVICSMRGVLLTLWAPLLLRSASAFFNMRGAAPHFRRFRLAARRAKCMCCRLHVGTRGCAGVEVAVAPEPSVRSRTGTRSPISKYVFLVSCYPKELDFVNPCKLTADRIHAVRLQLIAAARTGLGMLVESSHVRKRIAGLQSACP